MLDCKNTEAPLDAALEFRCIVSTMPVFRKGLLISFSLLSVPRHMKNLFPKLAICQLPRMQNNSCEFLT